jgi:hypothetical protein
MTENENKEITLGSKVKDKISGFTGIAISRTVFLNGCVRIEIDPDRLNKDGDLIEGAVFDEVQLEVVKVHIKKEITKPTHGYRDTIDQRKDIRNEHRNFTPNRRNR